MSITVRSILVLFMVVVSVLHASGAVFMQATVQSFMALIVMAMGVQFAFKGFSAYFHMAGA